MSPFDPYNDPVPLPKPKEGSGIDAGLANMRTARQMTSDCLCELNVIVRDTERFLGYGSDQAVRLRDIGTIVREALNHLTAAEKQVSHGAYTNAVQSSWNVFRAALAGSVSNGTREEKESVAKIIGVELDPVEPTTGGPP